MTELYWSNDGSVACKEHAPSRGSDTWAYGAWRKVTDADRAKAASIAERRRDAHFVFICATCDYMAQRRYRAEWEDEQRAEASFDVPGADEAREEAILFGEGTA